MYNIEIVTKVLISDVINLVKCNVYDDKKTLLKSDAVGTYFIKDNDITFINCDIKSPDIDNISDLCNNSIVFHFFNLHGLTYENG